MFGKVPAMKYASKEVFAVSPNDNMMYVRNIFMRRGISRVVVIDEDTRPLGVVSIRDLLEVMRELEDRYGGRDLDEITVEEAMAKNPVTIEEDASVKEACAIMAGRNIGSVILTDEDGKVLAIFTKTDATSAFADQGAGKWLVSDVMSRIVATANRFQSIKKLLDLFTKQRVDIVVVVDNKIPVGVVKIARLALIDEFKLLSTRVKKARLRGSIEQGVELGGKIMLVPKVEEVMTPIDSVVGEHDDLAKAASIMLMKRVSGVPVVDDYGGLTGLVTKTDIVRLISRV